MVKVIYLPHIAKSIKDNFPEIPFAHIFGSSSNREVKPGSDIDIGIWYNGTDPLIKLKVLAAIESVVTKIPIDIVNIYKADPILSHEVLAGVLLFVRNEQKAMYASFYTRVMAEYEDRMYWVKKQLQYRGYEVQWSN